MTDFRKGTRMGLHQRGVTLMELLVVITILGILSSLAVASYRRYTLRANRTDATMTLLRIQVAEEKFFLQNNRYAASMTEVTAGVSTPGLGITLLPGNKTLNGFYVISLPSAGVSTPTYTIQADATGTQLQDTGCLTLSIDQSGARLPVPSTGCWR